MKVWLGVIGRAFLEFAILLVLVAFAAGAATSIGSPALETRTLYESAASAAVNLLPLIAMLTLLLAFFSFEYRVRSRGWGWLGLFLLGAVLLAFGIGVRRVPFIHEVLAVPAGDSAKAIPLRAPLIPAGTTVQRGRVALWIGSFEGGEAVDAVAVDFGTDYPRLAYAPRTEIESSTGDMDIQGRTYRAALPAVQPMVLVPEASLFSGFWLWDRLAAMDGDPSYFPFAAAGGFLILLIGFRFLCRLTPWPLANALLAFAGLAGLVTLDAVLSEGAILGTLASLARRLGFSSPGPLLLAGIEGFVGLVLGAVDLATAPRRRMRHDE